MRSQRADETNSHGEAMSTIIAGRFEQSEQSDHAVEALVGHGIARSDISVFYVTPAGQHDATPIGGDEQESAGTERADSEAGAGAAIGGVSAGVVGAAVGVIAGLAAAAGAYGGSLAGAMSGTMDAGARHIRHAGMLVAIHATGADETTIVRTLRDAGALDVERADGTWAEGDWSDFDPTKPPHLIDAT
jgi:hypothetical protein